MNLPGNVTQLEFKAVVYATGLSAADARGAPYALAMVQEFDASLDVLHVVNPNDVKHPDRFSEIQRQFHALLEELVPQQTDAIRNPHGIVEAGSAHVRILEYLREFQVDLLAFSIHKSSHLWLQSRL